MDKKSLVNKINIILENSYVEESDNYIIARNQQRYLGRTENVDIENHPEDFDFVNKQVGLLKQLYLRLNLSDRKKFKRILLKKFIYENGTAFNTLIHINIFNETFNHIKKSYKSYRDNHIVIQLKLLTLILKNEWTIFSLKQIDAIYNWINDIFNGKNQIGKDYENFPNLIKDHTATWSKLLRQTNILLVKDLRSKLDNGVDLEIHADQTILKKEFKRFGFPGDLENTLERIDQKFSTAHDKFDYKHVMDLLRSFTERLYEQIAKSLDPIDGNKLDVKDSEKVAVFFQKIKFISEEQGKLLISLRHFLSNLGSHRLQSELEDARLSKNMTIEFSLYLIRRLDSIIKVK